MRTREIKFRVWSVTDRMMRSHEWLSAAQVVYSALTRERVDIHVMQYTGLKDKNGKEIYEGDRIMFQINFFENNAAWGENGFDGVVGWDKYGWSVSNVFFRKMLDQDYVFRMQGRNYDKELLERYSKRKYAKFSEVSHIEVIGNIYENPELLNP